MLIKLRKDSSFRFIDQGKGAPLVVLHGLMGGLSNFDKVVDFFPKHDYRVLVPSLPLYTMPLIGSNIKSLARFLARFIKHLGLEDVNLLGNSLGGHIALLYAKTNPKSVKRIIITGSSGLYEDTMGDSYPRRGDYDFVKKKTESVFYDPKVATKELVDDVFSVCSDRIKVIKTLSIAKSAIRNNVAKDLPDITMPSCVIWGKNDNVTPPRVAEEFHSLLPNSSLIWIDKCGHAPMMEHPHEFNTCLLEWLKTH